MIWIDGGIGQLLLGVAVLFAAGAALRGWFRTSWLASIFEDKIFEREEDFKRRTD